MIGKILTCLLPYFKNSGGENYFMYSRCLSLVRDLMHPAAVFGMLFGSDVFVDYVGELRLASIQAVEEEEDEVVPELRRQNIQEKLKVFLFQAVFINGQFQKLQKERVELLFIAVH